MVYNESAGVLDPNEVYHYSNISVNACKNRCYDLGPPCIGFEIVGVNCNIAITGYTLENKTGRSEISYACTWVGVDNSSNCILFFFFLDLLVFPVFGFISFLV